MEVYLAYSVMWLFITILITCFAPYGISFPDAFKGAIAAECLLALFVLSIYSVIWSIEVLKAQ